MIGIAETDEAIGRCFAVMSALRPQLAGEAFLPMVREMQAEGYRLAYAEADGEVVTVAGYRISTNFWLGRHLYVEDLVTAPAARSKGHGEAMLAWLREQARSQGCRFLDLDSGTQRGRAHKFYFGQGFSILGYHFGEDLSVPD